MHESEERKWSGSVVSDCSRPHGLQPTRLLHPWDSPGKNTGVGCHCLLHRRHLLNVKSSHPGNNYREYMLQNVLFWGIITVEFWLVTKTNYKYAWFWILDFVFLSKIKDLSQWYLCSFYFISQWDKLHFWFNSPGRDWTGEKSTGGLHSGQWRRLQEDTSLLDGASPSDSTSQD